MPKATKDTKNEELDKKKISAKKASESSQISKSTSKKTTAGTKKKSTKTTKSTSTKNNEKKESVKAIDKKEVKEKASKTTTKKTTTKKSSTTTNKKTSTSTTKKKSRAKPKKVESNVVAEYYDLPYRYNETVVKILYQTPTILFVYWDISDSDREKFINEYGENFFNNTKPVLKIFNLTKNYSFEVEINDFANSWYINVNDANCEYKVELARRTFKFEEKINTDYVYVSSSNNIEFPNDRILLNELPNKINFRNVKTNQINTKDIATMRLIGINKIYKVHDFYKRFYKDEILEEINSNGIINPSSSSW